MKMQIAMDYDQHNDLNNNNKNTYNDLQHTTHTTKELAITNPTKNFRWSEFDSTY
jgi:hypothetical protein